MSISTRAPLADYRAVVALNNTAVTLLERRCFRDSMASFKDALDLMGSLRPDSSNQRRPSADEQSVQFLQNASRRVARRSTRIVESSSATPSGFYLTAISHDNSAEAVTAALHEIPSDCTGFVFVIEFDESDVNLSIYSSIILHNFSVACRMQSREIKNTRKKRQLVERAFMFAQVANGILMQESSDILEDDLQLKRTLVVSMLILQELIQLSSQRGDMDTSRKYYCELGHLRSFVTDAEDGNLPLGTQLTAASAA